MIHTECILDIDRAFAFNTETAITRNREILFQRLFQPLIHAFDEFLLREFSHRMVVARKQTPRRVEPEQCHGVKSLFTQLWRENAVVGQRVAINFTRNFVRQSPLARLIVAHIHLPVAFVAMKRPAERLGRRVTRRLQFRQAAKEHVNFKHGPLIRGVGLK